MGRIISFKGTLAHEAVDQINIATNDGMTGYKIVKFQIFPVNFNVTDEYNVTVMKIPFTADTTFNFTDNRMIAAAYFENSSGVGSEGSWHDTVVFDNEKFNQDIFVGLASQSSNACNYYIELESMKLSLDEQFVATLKDIKNNNVQS